MSFKKVPLGASRQRIESQGVRLDRPIVCPAGVRYHSVMQGPACFCRIEQSEITAVEQPSTLGRYCSHAYQLCPTWRAAREADLAHKAVLQDHAPRPRQTVLDEDPELRDTFLVPRG